MKKPKALYGPIFAVTRVVEKITIVYLFKDVYYDEKGMIKLSV